MSTSIPTSYVFSSKEVKVGNWYSISSTIFFNHWGFTSIK